MWFLFLARKWEERNMIQTIEYVPCKFAAQLSIGNQLQHL